MLPLIVLSVLYERAAGNAIAVYGNMEDLGYYFTEFVVGGDRTVVSGVVDSASSLFAVCCAGCDGCTSSAGHCILASDLEGLVCQSIGSDERVLPSGAFCVGGKLEFSVKFTEGSSMSGSYVTSSVSLVGIPVEDRSENADSHEIPLGCIKRSSGLLASQAVGGVFGLSPSALSNRQFSLWNAVGLTSSVSVCLSRSGGELSEYNLHEWLKPDSSTEVWIPYVAEHDRYILSETRMSLSGFPGVSGRAMLDTGSTLTVVPGSVFERLKRLVLAELRSASMNVAGGQDKQEKQDVFQEYNLAGPTCFYGASLTSDILSRIPAIDLFFPSNDGGQVNLQLSPESYLLQRSPNVVCMYISSHELDSPFRSVFGVEFVLGLSFFRNKAVTFRQGRVISVVDNANCPIHELDEGHMKASRNKVDSDYTRPIDLGSVESTHVDRLQSKFAAAIVSVTIVVLSIPFVLLKLK